MEENENLNDNMDKNQKTEKGKGKAVAFIILAVVLIVTIAAAVIYDMMDKSIPKAYIQIVSNTDDMQNMINTIYEGVEEELPPTLNTQVVDISNVDILKSYTGLSSNENIDAVVVSEPMIGSQAYSLVLVKVKDGQDANAIAKEMSENIDTRKWICVEAEKLYATSQDNLAVLIMASNEWATPVSNRIKEILTYHGEEYTRESISAPEDQYIMDGGVIPE